MKRSASTIQKIDTFFKPAPANKAHDGESDECTTSKCVRPFEKTLESVPVEKITKKPWTPKVASSTANEDSKPTCSLMPPSMQPGSREYFDIGVFKDKLNIADNIKQNLLTKSTSSAFPDVCCPSRKLHGHYRKFQRSWLVDYEWLRYSFAEDTVYCVYCSLFGHKQSAFAKDPVKDWSNLGHLIRRHLKEGSKHYDCLAQGKAFLDTMTGKSRSVICQISSAYEDKLERNRCVLKTLLDIIILCAKMNIPLRGHDEEHSNFIQMVKFRAQTDKALAHHLEHAPPNARYLSPTIQNELINLCGDHIRAQIVASCNQARCFSILADETTDVSTTEQITLCVRFMEQNGITQKIAIREEFIGFVEAATTTGEDLADAFIGNLRKFDVNLHFMRGQGYDGAGNMSGCRRGVQARIRQIFPSAVYVHCQAHCLNLAVVHGCSNPQVRNMMNTVQQISFAFDYSAKRLKVFQNKLAEDEASQGAMKGATKIKKLCETRWCSRADALSTFKAAFPVIIEALAYLEQHADAKARAHKYSVLRFDFIVILVAVEHVLQYTLPLCKKLQYVNTDLVRASSEAANLKTVMQGIRGDERQWQELYTEAVEIAAKFDIQPSKPRTTGHQTQRANTPADTPSEYWKRAMFIPFLDHICTELQDRLLTDQERFIAQYLIPSRLDELTPRIEATVFLPFNMDISADNQLLQRTELKRWKAKWQDHQPLPEHLCETLEHADPDLYPSVNTALKTLLTMPVSTATPERTFSALRRTKTWLRNTMTQERLSGLAMLHIHRDRKLDTDIIMRQFAGNADRRLALVFND